MPQRTTLRSKVNRPRIERAARSIIREHGVDAISTRAVAARLGVTPMALYSVVADAAELRTLGLDAVLRTIPAPPPGGTPRARLRAWSIAARPVVARHPGLAEVSIATWSDQPQGCRIVDELLAVVAEVFDTPGSRAHVALAIFTQTMSAAMATRAAARRRRARTLPGRAVRADRVGRVPAPYPLLGSCEAAIRAADADRQAEFELDALLDGLFRGPTAG